MQYHLVPNEKKNHRRRNFDPPTSKIYAARPFIAKKIEAEMGLLDSGFIYHRQAQCFPSNGINDVGGIPREPYEQ
jgi:hypothetical protein